MGTPQPQRPARLTLLVGAGLLLVAGALLLRLRSPATPRGGPNAPTELSRLEAGAAADPRDIAAQYRLVSAYTRAGRTADAERVLQFVCSLAPREPRAWLALGEWEYGQSRYPSAALAYERASTLAPRSAEPLCGLAEVELKRGRIEQSGRFATLAQKLEPKAGRPHFIRGQILLRTAPPAAALPELRRATELEPDYLPAWISLASTSLELKDLTATEAACLAILRQQAGQPDALAMLADVYLSRGTEPDLRLAQQYAQQALNADAAHPEAHYVLGVIHLRASRLREAVQQLEAAVVADPSRIAARTNLSKAYRRLGRAGDADLQLQFVARGLEYEKQVNAVLEQVRVSPRRADLHLQLATLYLSAGGRSKAELEYQRALELDAHNPAAQAGLKRLVQPGPSSEKRGIPSP